MKKIFIDTNIIIDLLADRKPFSKYANELFTKAESKKLKLFASDISIVNTHYLLKKYIDEKELRSIISNLIDYITVIPVDTTIIKKALKSKNKDFEDAIQMICASSANVDCIVTRNIRDFKEAEIPVLSPDQLELK